MSVITFGAWRVIVLIQGQSGNGITVCTNSFRVRGPRCFHGHPFAYFGIHGAFFSGQVHDIAVCLASGIDTACNDQFGLVHGITACLASVIATACNHQVHRGGVDWYAWPIACDAFTAATWAALQAVDAAYIGVLNNFFVGSSCGRHGFLCSACCGGVASVVVVWFPVYQSAAAYPVHAKIR